MYETHREPARSPEETPEGKPAWTDRELADPHRSSEKADKVRAMFGAIADSYDLNNRVHSAGRDQAWRKYAVRAAGVRRGDSVLDVACGTGDLTEAFAATVAARVVGGDFTPRMLDIARVKQAALSEGSKAKIEYVGADATALQFGDASFDVVSIAFGIRNVTEPAKALAEFYRVLKPGGRLIVLEFDRPSFAPVRWLNDFYCGWVMPRTATWISGDKSGAYKYLPRSVATFLSRRHLIEAMERAGFNEVIAKSLTFGICVCYRGVKL